MILAAAAWGQKAAKPNLSGTWELDVAKSDFGAMPPPKSVLNIITHKEPFVEMDQTMVLAKGKFNAKLKYRTTAAQDANDSYGTTQTSWSKWFDNVFHIEAEVVAGKQFVRFRERWSLADGGKRLLNDRTVHMASGEIQQKLVYVRAAKAAKKGK